QELSHLSEARRHEDVRERRGLVRPVGRVVRVARVLGDGPLAPALRVFAEVVSSYGDRESLGSLGALVHGHSFVTTSADVILPSLSRLMVRLRGGGTGTFTFTTGAGA